MVLKRKFKVKVPRTQKAMTALVKKVVTKQAETKSAISHSTISQFDGSVYAQNLNFFLSQGVTSESIIGEKLMLKNIYLKMECFNINSSSASNQSLTFRVLIVRSKKNLTTTNSSILGSDIYRSGTSLRYSTNGHVDLHKVDLLYDKTIYFDQPNQANTDQHKPITANLKINKTHFVDIDNGGFFKDKNYYLIVTADKNSSQAANTSFCRYSWSLNFKDL